MPPCNIDVLIASRNGGVLLVGWLDDSGSRLERIEVSANGWSARFDGSTVARVRRPDVESALGTQIAHPFGFWGFVSAGRPMARGEYRVTLRLADGSEKCLPQLVRLVSDEEIRNIALTYLAESTYFGNRQMAAIASIEKAIGSQIVALNRDITRGLVATPYVERFGRFTRKRHGSIIVCLYGKAEYLFLQNALFTGLPGIDDYEFVYVSNSPELGEELLRQAKIAETIYGLDLTLVLLGGNAGFGAANNAATRYCSTNRYLIVNPDVFPYDRDWAQKHSAVVDNLAPDRTRLFGVPLFYDDGSLMHGGMHFELDSVFTVDAQSRNRTLVRVEHFGKGAPASAQEYWQPRPVPAVTGAFMSADRRWFEQLGGFTEDFVFGHYEDADLCLKSLTAGVAPWLHDIKLWHMEGKGSTRLPPHEGGSLVNRWMFSRKWADIIRGGLTGPKPTHALLAASEGPVAMTGPSGTPAPAKKPARRSRVPAGQPTSPL
jgi:GT2 family glycosyltransferase